MKIVLGVVVSLLASGYVVRFCFGLMNQPSDIGYIGGSLGVIVWFGFLYWCWRKIINKILKESEKDEASKSTAVNGNDSVGGGGVYN